MARINQIIYQEAAENIKAAYDAQIALNGSITNMKKTLLRSLPAYEALMQWYLLRNEALNFLTSREVTVFCHAISTQNDCLICSTYFRRDFLELGIKPEEFVFSEKEQTLELFGRQIVLKPNNIEDNVFKKLSSYFSEEQIVLLTAFGAIMVATNLINNVLKVDLDEALITYLKK